MKTAATFCISLLLSLGVLNPASAQDRMVSFAFDGLPLRQAIDSLMVWFPVSIIYLDQDVEGKTVRVHCDRCDLESALRGVLGPVPLDWIQTGNQVILRMRTSVPEEARVTVSGMVTDSLTGSPVGDATVVLRDVAGKTRRWCSANAYGFFSLREIPAGVCTLTVRAVGYRPEVVPLVVGAGLSLRHDLTLVPQEIALQEVTVEALRTSTAPAEGYARGVFIRSAPSDQNEYLLDGVRIYNPAHFGETMSTFSGEALNDVEITAGGLPPGYGGQIGGMLDLSLREGARDRIRGNGGVGTLGSSLSLEGPMSDASSFLISWRRAFPVPWVPALDEDGEPAKAGASEILVKGGTFLSGSSRLSLGAYWGHDSYSNEAEGRGRELHNTFSWGNRALSLRWTGIVSPSTFLLASAAYTRHDLAFDHTLAFRTAPYLSTYAIEDLCMRAHAEQYYDADHTIRAGVELIRHHLGGSINEFSLQRPAMTFSGAPIWEFSFYLQDQWAIVENLRIDLGGRATAFVGPEGTFSAIDPRVSMRYSVSEQTALLASLSAVHQYLHPYRLSGVFLIYPTTFWYPSTREAGPTTALHLTFGGIRDLEFADVSVESYYRIVADLHGVLPLTGMPGSGSIVTGTGKSYGIGVSLRRRLGNPCGSILYTLSRTEQSFDGVNSGRPERSPFDRRHELQAQIDYQPAGGWTVGVVAVLATGDPRVVPAELRRMVDALDAPAAAARAFLEANGSHAPGFERLELTLQKSIAMGNGIVGFSLRLVNGYGLLDPFRWDVPALLDPVLGWYATVSEIPLFPLYPTLSMNIRF